MQRPLRQSPRFCANGCTASRGAGCYPNWAGLRILFLCLSPSPAVPLQPLPPPLALPFPVPPCLLWSSCSPCSPLPVPSVLCFISPLPRYAFTFAGFLPCLFCGSPCWSLPYCNFAFFTKLARARHKKSILCRLFSLNAPSAGNCTQPPRIVSSLHIVMSHNVEFDATKGRLQQHQS
jgi:hypothetical protein